MSFMGIGDRVGKFPGKVPSLNLVGIHLDCKDPGSHHNTGTIANLADLQ